MCKIPTSCTQWNESLSGNGCLFPWQLLQNASTCTEDKAVNNLLYHYLQELVCVTEIWKPIRWLICLSLPSLECKLAASTTLNIPHCLDLLRKMPLICALFIWQCQLKVSVRSLFSSVSGTAYIPITARERWIAEKIAFLQTQVYSDLGKDTLALKYDVPATNLLLQFKVKPFL